jgi:hypothetical protein
LAYVAGWNRPDRGRFVFVAIDVETSDVVSTQLIDIFTRDNTADATGRGHPGQPFVRLFEASQTDAVVWNGTVAADDAMSAPQRILPPPRTLAAAEEEEPRHAACRWDRDGAEVLVHFGHATTAAALRGLKCCSVDAVVVDGIEVSSPPDVASSCYAGASVNEALRVFGMRQLLLYPALGGSIADASPLRNVVFTYSQRAGGPLIPTACRAIARFVGSWVGFRRFALASSAAFSDGPSTAYTHRVVEAAAATAAAAAEGGGGEARSGSPSSVSGSCRSTSAGGGDGEADEWQWAGRSRADASPQGTPSHNVGTPRPPPVTRTTATMTATTQR